MKPQLRITLAQDVCRDIRADLLDRVAFYASNQKHRNMLARIKVRAEATSGVPFRDCLLIGTAGDGLIAGFRTVIGSVKIRSNTGWLSSPNRVALALLISTQKSHTEV